jgi:hypothetical protein
VSGKRKRLSLHNSVVSLALDCVLCAVGGFFLC